MGTGGKGTGLSWVPGLQGSEGGGMSTVTRQSPRAALSRAIRKALGQLREDTPPMQFWTKAA